MPIRKRVLSAKALARFVEILTDEEALVFADDPQGAKAALAQLAAEAAKNTFVFPLDDDEAIALLVEKKVHTGEKAREIVSAWRKYAAAMGYTGPVAWQVNAGFIFKKHAPLAGPCYKNLAYLQDWEYENDEPTVSSVIFWVPRLAEGSLGKNLSDMEKLRVALRQQHGLPEHHCDRFGSIALLFALILAHFKRTGERVLTSDFHAVTDNHAKGASCGEGWLAVGGFDKLFGNDGLRGGWWGGYNGCDRLGFFLLGVETLGE